jgi:hypothetical protein
MPVVEMFISQHMKNERHLVVSQARASKDVLAQRGVLPSTSITRPRLPAIVALAGTPHPDDQLARRFWVRIIFISLYLHSG